MKKAIFLIAILTFSARIFAAEPTLQLNAEKTTLGQYETIKIQLVLTNAEAESLEWSSNLEEVFQLIQGPAEGAQMSIVNGRSQMIRYWTYQVRPLQTGTFTLQPCFVMVDGEKLESNSLTFSILEQDETDLDPNDPRAIAAKLTYFRIIPSKLQVYVGEPFGVTYRLYGKVRPSAPIEFLEQPSYDDFFAENVEHDIQGRQDLGDDGEPIMFWDYRIYSMVAQRPGTYEFDPLVSKIPTPVRTNRMSPWGTTVNNINTAYHPDVMVLPLPEEGRPENFSGGVGDLAFSAKASRNELNVGESITFEIRVSGHGNLELVELPELNLPDQLEVYEPEDDMSVQPSSSGPRGEITRKYIIVPRYRGTYKIPSLDFSYFDPETGQYVTISSEEEIIVAEGDGPAYSTPESSDNEPSAPVATTRQRDVEMLSNEIRWIHPNDDGEYRSPSPFYSKTWFVGGLGGTGLITAWLLLAGAVKKWRDEHTDLIQKQAQIALKRIPKASGWLELEDIFGDFLAKGFDIERASHVRGILEIRLQAKGMSEDEAKAAYQLLYECEAAEYGDSTKSIEVVGDEMKRWIQNQLK